MKIFSASLVLSAGLAQKDDRGLPERYLYEKPICTLLDDCRGRKGCDAKLFTEDSGVIEVKNYEPEFNCRWEIKGTPGTSIKVKVEEGESFGVEYQTSCGFDRLHIRSADGKGFGRLCSSKSSAAKPYNGMADWETYNETKMRSSSFRQWLELPTSHLVVAFDTDRQVQGAGFKIFYEITGAGQSAPADEVAKELNSGLDNLIDNFATKEQHKSRLGKRLVTLFQKYDSRMVKCGKTNTQVAQFDSGIFSTGNLEEIEAEWLRFYRAMFNSCDLPIIKNSGGFDNTSWPRRIRRWIRQLGRDL